jgi:magnesium chelatase family protein
MSIAKSYSAQLVGLQSLIVTIEVDISNGLHAFSVVGLGDRAVEESKDRIAAAIKNTGYVSPKQKNQKVVVSLAPADIRKEGPSFELAMALTYLSAASEISFDQNGKLFIGELSLEGTVRRVPGILPILCQAPSMGFTEAFVPHDNIHEASLARGMKIFAVSSLREAVDHLTGVKELEQVQERVSICVLCEAMRQQKEVWK